MESPYKKAEKMAVSRATFCLAPPSGTTEHFFNWGADMSDLKWGASKTLLLASHLYFFGNVEGAKPPQAPCPRLRGPCPGIQLNKRYSAVVRFRSILFSWTRKIQYHLLGNHNRKFHSERPGGVKCELGFGQIFTGKVRFGSLGLGITKQWNWDWKMGNQ